MVLPQAAYSQFGEQIDYVSPGIEIGYRGGDNGGIGRDVKDSERSSFE